MSSNPEETEYTEETPLTEAELARIEESATKAEGAETAEGDSESVHLTEEDKLEALTAEDNDPEHSAGPEADARSIYVGNVDYSTKPEELQELFQSCGTINRVTILCDRHTGHPKGYAYVEFASKEAVEIALTLSDTPLKGRPIKVTEKRTNVPGRGRGRRAGGGRGGFGGFNPYGGFRGAFPFPGYRVPRFRGRRPLYHPYAYS